MRDRSPLGWLAGTLWGWTAAAVFFFLTFLVPGRRDSVSFDYLRLSRAGILTTATIQDFEGYVQMAVLLGLACARSVAAWAFGSRRLQ